MLDNITGNLNLDNRIPIVHKYIHRKILERGSKLLKDIPADETRIERVCMRRFLSRYMVPIEIQNTFLKEMEHYGLIKIKNKRIIELIVK
ncbi:hypothetical protein LCGC14_1547650 [marine sediment metagenome]|uniref:Translation elongation factor SelB winged helix type 3 domain-containing protein n=1 Tax=marine sediment metagenome TaxID=412755 RepID=A0A0F9JC80_9ZZZZ